MGFWSNLFGSGREATPATDEQIIRIHGSGEIHFEIVGESHYQDALNKLAGGKTEDGHRIETEATLILDNNNQYDDKAVAVAIRGEKVGHLSRETARSYRKSLAEAGVPAATGVCGALIVSGWQRGSGDEGHYGVKLDLPAA